MMVISVPGPGGISGAVRTSHANALELLLGKNWSPKATSSLMGAVSETPTECSTTSQNVSGRAALVVLGRFQIQSPEPSTHSMRDAELSNKSSTERGLVSTLTAAVPQMSVAHDLRALSICPA